MTAKNGKAARLVIGFEPENVVVLTEKGDNLQIWAFTNEYKGRTNLHIREVYRTADEGWAPSNKGISVPIASASAAIKKLATMKLLHRVP